MRDRLTDRQTDGYTSNAKLISLRPDNEQRFEVAIPNPFQCLQSRTFSPNPRMRGESHHQKPPNVLTWNTPKKHHVKRKVRKSGVINSRQVDCQLPLPLKCKARVNDTPWITVVCGLRRRGRAEGMSTSINCVLSSLHLGHRGDIRDDSA